jgi:2-phosphosulfolactate phosphatase
MQIEILQLVEGAKKAKGLTVIIDVFRAFTVECYLVNRGAKSIIPIGDINDAYKLKQENPDYILIGERFEKRPEGFDFGNSPSQVKDFDFTGKSIVHTTSSGTQGIVNAVNADEIITGSFVNVGAIIEYIKQKNPTNVSLVAMGYASEYPTEEDTFCAEYIKNSLEGNSSDYEEMKEIIRNTSGKRFFVEEKQGHAPEIDFHLCLEKSIFNFVLKITKNNGYHMINKIDIDA